ncbi:MAG: hypothetical protein ACI9S8_003044 [Chlamydiales bacterium]|jgi:hypothetical protein
MPEEEITESKKFADNLLDAFIEDHHRIYGGDLGDESNA